MANDLLTAVAYQQAARRCFILARWAIEQEHNPHKAAHYQRAMERAAWAARFFMGVE